jgi:polysaccharide biosynthesis protein PslG
VRSVVKGGSRRLAAAVAVALFAAVGVPVAAPNTVGAAPNAQGGYGSNLGLNITVTESLSSDLYAAALSKAKWVRLDAFWLGVQAAGPDSWDWTQLDQRVLVAELLGLKVLLIPTYAPPWAALPKCKSGRCGPKDASAYAAFVSAAAQRYSPGGTLGTHVEAWEIWNEPNGPGFGPNPDPVEYTEMLKLSAAAIRVFDPKATILTGGTAPSPDSAHPLSYAPETFLTAIYKAGAKGSFTGVANHPYSGVYPPMYQADWNAFYATPKLHRIMQKYGDGSKKIWGTEFGYSSSKNPDFGLGRRGQAAYLEDAIKKWNTWTFAGPLFVYNLRDNSPDDVSKFDSTGLLNYDGSPKPSWKVFRDLARGTLGP